jgi:hypothetical protein
MTEELREITYADQVVLRVVDHPDGLDVIPNEKFVAPPFPEDRLFAVSDHQVPLSAFDENGTDGDAGIEISREPEVTHGSCVRSSPRRFRFKTVVFFSSITCA